MKYKHFKQALPFKVGSVINKLKQWDYIVYLVF
nr:MAG TPA: hypothetical protein [Caudoviricetes sp.]